QLLAQSRAPDLLDPDAPPPLRESTIEMRRKILRQLAAARVNRRTPPHEIQGIADLVRPAQLRDALTFFVEREGCKMQTIINRAIIGRSIARRFLTLPGTELAELDKICRGIHRKLCKAIRPGLTDQNKKRLAQFLNANNVEALHNLPLRLSAQAKRGPIR